jgi:hypothetical protein
VGGDGIENHYPVLSGASVASAFRILTITVMVEN